jgi:hypothetical protein
MSIFVREDLNIYNYDTGITTPLKRGSEVQVIGFIRTEAYPEEIVVDVQWKHGDDWVFGKPLMKFFRADPPGKKKSKLGVAMWPTSPKEIVSALDYYAMNIYLTSSLLVLN